MKKIFKLFSLLILSGSLLFTSCETLDLELLDDPNSLSPEQSSVEFLLNSIQLTFAGSTENLNLLGAGLTRIEQFQIRNYENDLPPSTANSSWSNFYQGLTTDITAMRPGVLEENQFQALGLAQTLQAYYLVNLIDVLGDIPFSQIEQPEQFPQPEVDDDASLYEVAFDLLDTAEANLTDPTSITLPTDNYYGGNIDNWVRLINTLRMKMYLQTRLVNPDALTEFQAIVDEGNFITAEDNDFQFQWGSNFQNPNTRHPSYNSDYTTTGANSYRSNWLMNLMITTNDPRTRYYFYRQSSCTPGASCDTDGNTSILPCSIQDAPSHYEGFPFCYLENGYWGRDHGDNLASPGDGFLRTAPGVYPAAGLFDNGEGTDDDTFGLVGLEEGGRGAGISPFMLASHVDFMRAEAALASGDNITARGFIIAGLQKSFDKVASFADLDPEANSDLFMTATTTGDFIQAIETSFDAGSTMDQWNILGEQFFTTQYGSGLDAFNFYRRTGFPTTLQPSREPSPGNFPKTFFYPLNEISTNTNLEQKPDLGVQVFWDNNPAGPNFPIAN